MAESRFKELREKTGLSAYAFGSELEKRQITMRDYYQKIDAGKYAPGREIEDGIIRVNAELRGLTFNDVLIELRGEVEQVAA